MAEKAIKDGSAHAESTTAIDRRIIRESYVRGVPDQLITALSAVRFQ
jgi:hypothetical protein